MGFLRILCPIDFSADSAEAFERAIELARGPGCELELLHVLPPLLPTSPASRQAVGAVAPAEGASEHEAERALTHELDGWCARARAAGVAKVTGRVVRGDPAEEIILRSEQVDLVLIGTHGRTGLLRSLLGGVAYKVVRAAHCSVLTHRRRSG